MLRSGQRYHRGGHTQQPPQLVLRRPPSLAHCLHVLDTNGAALAQSSDTCTCLPTMFSFATLFSRLFSRPVSCSALHAAAQRGPLTLLQLLLAHKADVDLVDSKGTALTPLHLASRAGAAAKVQALLDAGAQVAPVNSQGNTPLHLVSVSRCCPLVSPQVVPASVVQRAGMLETTFLCRGCSLCPAVQPLCAWLFQTSPGSLLKPTGHRPVAS